MNSIIKEMISQGMVVAGMCMCIHCYACVCVLMHASIIMYKCNENEVGCRDDTVPKTVETRRHYEED